MLSITQINALTKCQEILIKSLKPEQYDAWMDYCETCTDGDVVDGVQELIHFINTNELPDQE